MGCQGKGGEACTKDGNCGACVEATCPSCGKPNLCQKSTDCWCTQYPSLDPEQYAAVNPSTKACLCETCLMLALSEPER